MDKRLPAIIALLEKQRKALDNALVALYEMEHHPPVVKSRASFEDHEKALIARAIKRAKGNQSAAARLLGIGRDRLRYKMRKYGLDRRT